mgnify:CR=1
RTYTENIGIKYQEKVYNYLKNYIAGRVTQSIADLFLYAYSRCAHQKTSWDYCFVDFNIEEPLYPDTFGGFS